MKQSIYYVKLTDGTEMLSITRIDAVEKVNAHYINEKHYKPITMAVLDRLIMTGNKTSFIERTTKQTSNEYYKEEIALFIKNDKKDRTEDALKKAISRYVNKLFYGGGEIKNNIKTDKTINNNLTTIKNDTNNVIDIITDETDITEDKIINVIKTDNTIINGLTTVNNDLTTENIDREPELETQIITYDTKPIDAIILDEIKTVDIINDDLTTLDISNEDLTTIDNSNDEIKTVDNSNDEIKTVDIINDEGKSIDIINDEIKTVDNINDEIKTVDIINDEIKTIKLTEEATEESINPEDVIKQLCDYLGENHYDNDINNVRLYYKNNKEEVETAYKNNELQLTKNKEKVRAKKKKKNIRKSFNKSIKKQKQTNHKSSIKKQQ